MGDNDHTPLSKVVHKQGSTNVQQSPTTSNSLNINENSSLLSSHQTPASNTITTSTATSSSEPGTLLEKSHSIDQQSTHTSTPAQFQSLGHHHNMSSSNYSNHSSPNSDAHLSNIKHDLSPSLDQLPTKPNSSSSASSNSASSNRPKPDSFEGEDVSAAATIAAILHANEHLSHQPLSTSSQQKSHESQEPQDSHESQEPLGSHVPEESHHSLHESASNHPQSSLSEKLEDTPMPDITPESSAISDRGLDSLVNQQHRQQHQQSQSQHHIYNQSSLPLDNSDYINMLRHSPASSSSSQHQNQIQHNNPHSHNHNHNHQLQLQQNHQHNTQHQKSFSRDTISHDTARRLAKMFQNAETSLDILAADISKSMENSLFVDPFLAKFSSALSFIRASSKALQDKLFTAGSYNNGNGSGGGINNNGSSSSGGEINMFDVYTSAVQLADLNTSDLSFFVDNNSQNSAASDSGSRHGNHNTKNTPGSSGGSGGDTGFYSSGLNTGNGVPLLASGNSSSIQPLFSQQRTLNINDSSSSSSGNTVATSNSNRYQMSNDQAVNTFFALSRPQDQMFSAATGTGNNSNGLGNQAYTSSSPSSSSSFKIGSNSADQLLSGGGHRPDSSGGGGGHFKFINVSMKPNSSGSRIQKNLGTAGKSSMTSTPPKSTDRNNNSSGSHNSHNNNDEDIIMGIPMSGMSSESSPGNYFMSNEADVTAVGNRSGVSMDIASASSSSSAVANAPSSSGSRDAVSAAAAAAAAARYQSALEYSPFMQMSSTVEDSQNAPDNMQSSSDAEGSLSAVDLSNHSRMPDHRERRSSSNSSNRTGEIGVGNMGSTSSGSTKKVYSSDGTEVPQYRMSRDISTLQEMVREWYEGLNGGPSVRHLETQYGSKWRTKNDAERVFLGRRKVIINKIEESIRASNGKRTFDEIVEEMEEERKRLKKSIDGLGRYYNQVAAKEKHVQAIQQERATAAAVAAAVAAATAHHRVVFDSRPQTMGGQVENSDNSHLEDHNSSIARGNASTGTEGNDNSQVSATNPALLGQELTHSSQSSVSHHSHNHNHQHNHLGHHSHHQQHHQMSPSLGMSILSSDLSSSHVEPHQHSSIESNPHNAHTTNDSVDPAFFAFAATEKQTSPTSQSHGEDVDDSKSGNAQSLENEMVADDGHDENDSGENNGTTDNKVGPEGTADTVGAMEK